MYLQFSKLSFQNWYSYRIDSLFPWFPSALSWSVSRKVRNNVNHASYMYLTIF